MYNLIGNNNLIGKTVIQVLLMTRFLSPCDVLYIHVSPYSNHFKVMTLLLSDIYN